MPNGANRLHVVLCALNTFAACNTLRSWCRIDVS